MKKKMLSFGMVVAMTLSMLVVSGVQVQASGNLSIIDGSYLTHDEESTGYTNHVARGEDLMTGYSKGVRLDAGVFYAGGTTIARQTVERVGVAVIVERALEDDEEWTFYDCWEKFNENADRVGANRRLEVEGGYYYRVRCTHSANDDMSSSFTNGVYIEEPSLIP